MIVKLATKKDAQEIKPAIIMTAGRFMYDTYETLCDQGGAYSGFVNGRCAGIAGIMRLSEHVGEGWAILSALALQDGFSLTRNANRYIKKMESQYKRVHCYTEAYNHIQHRWAMTLGFQYSHDEPCFSHDGTTAKCFLKLKGRDY